MLSRSLFAVLLALVAAAFLPTAASAATKVPKPVIGTVKIDADGTVVLIVKNASKVTFYSGYSPDPVETTKNGKVFVGQINVKPEYPMPVGAKFAVLVTAYDLNGKEAIKRKSKTVRIQASQP